MWVKGSWRGSPYNVLNRPRVNLGYSHLPPFERGIDPQSSGKRGLLEKEMRPGTAINRLLQVKGKSLENGEARGAPILAHTLTIPIAHRSWRKQEKSLNSLRKVYNAFDRFVSVKNIATALMSLC